MNKMLNQNFSGRSSLGVWENSQEKNRQHNSGYNVCGMLRLRLTQTEQQTCMLFTLSSIFENGST